MDNQESHEMNIISPVSIEGLELSGGEVKFFAKLIELGIESDSYGIAYREAGYPVDNDVQAQIKGRELARKENVAIAISRYLNGIIGDYKISFEKRVLDMLEVRSTWKLNWFFDCNGRLKPLDQIPEKYHCVIDAIRIKHYGKDGDITEKELDLPNRETSAKLMLAILNKQEDLGEKVKGEDSQDKIKAILARERKKTEKSVIAAASAGAAFGAFQAAEQRKEE